MEGPWGKGKQPRVDGKLPRGRQGGASNTRCCTLGVMARGAGRCNRSVGDASAPHQSAVAAARCDKAQAHHRLHRHASHSHCHIASTLFTVARQYAQAVYAPGIQRGIAAPAGGSC